jgi:hypothetical protein
MYTECAKLGLYTRSATARLAYYACVDSPFPTTKLQTARPVLLLRDSQYNICNSLGSNTVLCPDCQTTLPHCEDWVMSDKYSVQCFRARGFNVSSKTAFLFDALMWKRPAKRMQPVKQTRWRENGLEDPGSISDTGVYSFTKTSQTPLGPMQPLLDEQRRSVSQGVKFATHLHLVW